MIVFYRIIKSAFLGLRRNGWLSLIATFMMVQALLLFSIFVVLNAVIGSAITAINQKIDLAVYLKNTATEEEILALEEEIKTFPEVRSVRFVSTEEALASFLAQTQNKEALEEFITAEDALLPASFEVEVTDPFQLETVEEKIGKSANQQAVDKTSFTENQEIVKKLRGASSFVKRMNITLSSLFIVLALLIIFNTIRMAIFARREEIEVMKLVGATDWYIRWPFIIEGMLYGFLGALVSTALLLGGYLALVRPLTESYLFGGLPGAQMLNLSFFLWLLLAQVVVGTLVGAISSILATRRHLDV